MKKYKKVRIRLNVKLYKAFRLSGEVQVFSRKSRRVPYYDILELGKRACRAYVGREGYYYVFRPEELYMEVPEYFLEIFEDLEKL